MEHENALLCKPLHGSQIPAYSDPSVMPMISKVHDRKEPEYGVVIDESNFPELCRIIVGPGGATWMREKRWTMRRLLRPG